MSDGISEVTLDTLELLWRNNLERPGGTIAQDDVLTLIAEVRRQATVIRWIPEMQADAWNEGLSAGQDRWSDSREFGDPPTNPYREEQ